MNIRGNKSSRDKKLRGRIKKVSHVILSGGAIETKEILSQNSWWEHAWQKTVKAVQSREKVGMEAGELMLDQATKDIGSEWRNPDFTLGVLVSYCWVCTRDAKQYDCIISDLGGAKVGSKGQLKDKNSQ